MADIIARGMASNALVNSKSYTDEKITQYIAGLNYQGAVNSYGDLPASSTKGYCYNVKTTTSAGSTEFPKGLYVFNGSAWNSFTIKGADGEDGEDGNGIASVTLNADYTLTLNFTDGTSWTSSVSIRGPQGAQGPQGADGKVQDVYVGEVSFLDANNKANLQPIQDQINNLKNIGRFLSIWNCVTGLPTSDPIDNPYSYRTGDYYRIGTVASESGINYKPNGSTYTRTASTTVETNSVEISYVYYYDGTDWLLQSAGGGGTVQDVQINGVSKISSETGVANITDSDIQQIKYTSQVLSSAQQLQARTNIGAWSAEEYSASASSYADNTFFYVVED